ncbi:MAG: DUF2892 domain-containing protein [Calditrichaeota bacterium]|nr:MAG: DUF2892 domain-containing protein [Calditrichota bacterium]
MIKNVGGADKIIRYIIGIVLAAWGVYAQSWWGLLAIIPIGTALMNFCPMWFLFKVNTAAKE